MSAGLLVKSYTSFLTLLPESGTVDFDEFLKVVTTHWKDPEDEERELIEAFQVMYFP